MKAGVSWVKTEQVSKAALHVVAHNRGEGIPKNLNQRQGPVVWKAAVRGRRSCGRACMRMRGALTARGSFSSKNRPCVDGSVASLADPPGLPCVTSKKGLCGVSGQTDPDPNAGVSSQTSPVAQMQNKRTFATRNAGFKCEVTFVRLLEDRGGLWVT